MKRYMRGFVATITSLALMSGVASADTAEPATCTDGQATITSTGPGSVNIISCVDSKEIHVTCDNNIYVVNDNSQTANSGNADNSGNTNGGSSVTGDATNENGTTVQIGASCVSPAAVTPESPTPQQPTTTPVNGMGAGAPSAEAAQAIAVLPNTSSNTVLDSILIGVSSLAALLITSRFGAAAYRRFALR